MNKTLIICCWTKYLKLSRSRSTDNILARNGFKRFKTAVKTIFLSSFFENDVSFIVNELFNKSNLVKGLKFWNVVNGSRSIWRDL